MKTVQEIISWLKTESKRPVILVEVMQVGIGVSSANLYLSNVPFTSISTDSPASTAYLPIVVGGVSFSESLDYEGSLSIGYGDIEIANHGGINDAYLNYIWSKRSVQILIGDASWPRSSFRPIFTGVISDGVSKSRNTINLVLLDKMERLNVAVSEELVNNSEVSGDTLVPLTFGECFNVTPVSTKPSSLEYQVHRGLIESIIEVRDNGVPVSFTPILTAGKFTLNQSPYGQITCSVQGHKVGSTYFNTVPELIKQLVKNFGPTNTRYTDSDIDLDNFSEFNAIYPSPVGVYCTNRENILDICNQLANSIGCGLTTTGLGKLRLVRIHPAGLPLYTYSISSALPAGLSFNTRTGEITGTPTVNAGPTSRTVTATDYLGATSSDQFSLTVQTSAPSIATYNATLNIRYSNTQQLQFVNFYTPTNAPVKGVVFYVKGGAWQSDNINVSPTATRQLPIDLVEKYGYAVIDVNYRGWNATNGSDGTGIWPNSALDVVEALKCCLIPGTGDALSAEWANIRNYVTEHGGLMVYGTSAGGHLAITSVCSLGNANNVWPKAVVSSAGPMTLDYSTTFIDSIVQSVVINPYASTLVARQQASPFIQYGSAASPGPWFNAVNSSPCKFYFLHNRNDTLITDAMSIPTIQNFQINNPSKTFVTYLNEGPTKGNFLGLTNVTSRGATPDNTPNTLPSTGQQLGDYYSTSSGNWVYNQGTYSGDTGANYPASINGFTIWFDHNYTTPEHELIYYHGRKVFDGELSTPYATLNTIKQLNTVILQRAVPITSPIRPIVAVGGSAKLYTITPEDIEYQSLSISDKLPIKSAVKISYCKNWTVQESGLAGGVPTSSVNLFNKEWMFSTVKNDTVSYNYKTDTEPTQEDSLLVTKKGAEEEADSRLSMFSSPRFIYTVSAMSHLLPVELGDSIRLVNTRYDLINGKIGIVVSADRDWLTRRITIGVLV
jgi:acetyl esterase/lipase